MIQALPDLVKFVKETIPDPRSILNLQIKEKIGAVVFIWHGVEFLVKPSLHVFEVRGYQLYITGISTLLQVVFMRRTKNEKMFEEAADCISQAEDLIRVHNRYRDGMQLLGEVRGTLSKLVGR
ncbi:MAG: hypothetical protein HY735_37810 [Verrucomicrobia bacterium]|nr:hypothetical protein [Verrucomicrobiota bacterium]